MTCGAIRGIKEMRSDIGDMYIVWKIVKKERKEDEKKTENDCNASEPDCGLWAMRK